jgi:uncharacterized protein (DUF1330 family)
LAGYVIADVEVHDPAGYEEYRSQTLATVQKYDGEFLVRGGQVEVVEGEWAPTRLIIIKFPSTERAREWADGPEYSAIKGIRQRTAKSNVIIIEGA